MLIYTLSRLGQGLVVLWLVSVIGFAILQLVPGGPFAEMLLTPGLNQEDIDRISRQLGLDQPLPIQYAKWLGSAITGDLGISYRDSRPVTQIIADHVPATLELMFASSVLAALFGTAVGVYAAVRRGSAVDSLSTVGVMVMLSIPTFWFGLMLIYVFSVVLGWLPSGYRYTLGDGSLLNRLHHLIAPTIVLTFVSTAVWSRYMRASMLEVLAQDYMRTARAKGLPEPVVILRYGVRNALLPMISIAGVYLPTLLGGALVTETVFSWPGIGRLFLDSLNYRDYPVVMGLLLFSAVLVLLSNLLADLLYTVADPRVSLD